MFVGGNVLDHYCRWRQGYWWILPKQILSWYDEAMSWILLGNASKGGIAYWQNRSCVLQKTKFL